MIPNVDPAQLEHESEAPVYVALRDQLSDDFTVLHSYPWLRPWRDEGALAEGETDFVVLHRRYGLLVLEVKGGRGIWHDGRKWYRDSGRGPREFQDPFDQARRNMHALLEIVEERSDGYVTGDDFVYGYAVVFPHVDYEGDPPPNADRAIVVSERHLASMDRAVGLALKAWGRRSRGLGDEKFDILLNKCLKPKFRILRRIGPQIATASDKLLELTEYQAQVFEGLYAQHRVLVEGVAGSGKTFLALARALAFARAGKRVLFACYNSALAGWLRSEVDDDPSTRQHRSNLSIKNFHALAKELVERAGIGFNPAGGGRPGANFWDEEVPDLLEQAVLDLDLRGYDVKYDALVVDEAQDFSLGWWYALTESLLRTENDPIYAFMDPNQSLRGKVKSPPIAFDTTFRLDMNCRNTRKIATASASVLELQSRTFGRAPVGAALRLLRARTRAHQLELVLREVERMLLTEGLQPRQMVLIGPSAKAKGSVSDVDKVAGVPLTTDANAWRDGQGILVTTSRYFKGLEADVVLLYDLGDFGNLFQKKDLYVACTRAKFLLIAIADGKGCRAVLEAASRASEEEA